MSRQMSVEMLKSPPSHWGENKVISRASMAPPKRHVDSGGSSLTGMSASGSGTLLSEDSCGSGNSLRFRRDDRPYNTLSFAAIPEGQVAVAPLPMVESMTSQEHERMLTQELLYVLSGTESLLIAVHNVQPNRIRFTFDSRLEPSLKELAQEISQVAVHYHSVTRFVENWCKFEHGQVNQALVAAMRAVLKDYFILLSQIETLHLKGELTLQKMWFFLHPTLQVMSIISSIVIDIEEQDCRGGTVLTLLHEKAVSMVGDAVGRNLCFELAQKASTPYFIMLENWIYKGMIKDPFGEFLVLDSDVREGAFELNCNYWETRYKLEPKKCPSFLAQVDQEVLKAGKYLNVIRQCGKDVCMSADSKISYSIHKRVYVNAIEKAYAFASRTLLDLLLNEYDLMRRVQSVKHYLLMDQGDFIVQFLDLTENELSKKIDDLNPVRLESLLELALRTSSSTTDPYKDCVRVELFPYGIAEQMLHIIHIETPLEHAKTMHNFSIPGFEAFSFSYEVQWPISLVLNSRVISCYQMIFRHLFYCKHVERQLSRVWIAKKSFKDSDLTNDLEKAATFSLRQKMLNFVQNLQYYMAFEVIEPAWHIFITTMSKVMNVDQVLDCHVGMVNSILNDSMLTSSTLLARMTNLLSLCLQFSEKVLVSADDSSISVSTLSMTIEDITQKFNLELIAFLKEVSTVVQNPNQSSKVANIIYRVNFNGFYTSELEHGSDSRLGTSSHSDFPK